MLIDVNSPLIGESIDRSAPWTTYDVSYLERTFAVVEAFKDYPNTLLFFAGNEVINDDDTGKTVGPYMRVGFPNLSTLHLKLTNTGCHSRSQELYRQSFFPLYSSRLQCCGCS